MANKKNEKGVIIVHEFPRGKRTPSPSPYVMKLETFLRMNKIPYEPGKQSRINIGSDGTLARAPVWMGFERGPPIYFLDPYLFKYYKTEYNVQKNMGITLPKN